MSLATPPHCYTYKPVAWTIRNPPVQNVWYDALRLTTPCLIYHVALQQINSVAAAKGVQIEFWHDGVGILLGWAALDSTWYYEYFQHTGPTVSAGAIAAFGSFYAPLPLDNVVFQYRMVAVPDPIAQTLECSILYALRENV